MKIRKRFLKPIAIFMAITMLVSLGSMSAANDNTEVEIIVCDSVECPQKQQLIIDTVNGENGTIGISPASILCIFGHNLATTNARVITHRHWTTAPRCREVSHRITYCTRSGCNYSVSTVISDIRISCCP